MARSFYTDIDARDNIIYTNYIYDNTPAGGIMYFLNREAWFVLESQHGMEIWYNTNDTGDVFNILNQGGIVARFDDTGRFETDYIESYSGGGLTLDSSDGLTYVNIVPSVGFDFQTDATFNVGAGDGVSFFYDQDDIGEIFEISNHDGLVFEIDAAGIVMLDTLAELTFGNDIVLNSSLRATNIYAYDGTLWIGIDNSPGGGHDAHYTTLYSTLDTIVESGQTVEFWYNETGPGFTGELLFVNTGTTVAKFDKDGVFCVDEISEYTLGAGVSFGTVQLHDIVDPDEAQDAATKQYVDDHSGGGGSRTLYFMVQQNDTYGWYRGLETTGAGIRYVSFAMPDDLAAITSLELILIPKGNVAGNVNLYSQYAADGETKATHAEQNLAFVVANNQDILSAWDLTSVFSVVTAGDDCGLKLDHQGIGASVIYLFVKLVYTV